jgi:hypothetical protein
MPECWHARFLTRNHKGTHTCTHDVTHAHTLACMNARLQERMIERIVAGNHTYLPERLQERMLECKHTRIHADTFARTHLHACKRTRTNLCTPSSLEVARMAAHNRARTHAGLHTRFILSFHAVMVASSYSCTNTHTLVYTNGTLHARKTTRTRTCTYQGMTSGGRFKARLPAHTLAQKQLCLLLARTHVLTLANACTLTRMGIHPIDAQILARLHVHTHEFLHAFTLAIMHA